MGGSSDVDRDYISTLAEKVIPHGANEPFGVYMFHGTDPASDLGRQVERDVFLESFGNTSDLLDKEYEPYEPASLFLCVLDQMRRLPAGVMRLVMPSEAGFKSLNDLGPVWGTPAEELIERTGMGLDPSTTWDIATLAINEEYRGKATMGLVAMGLYQGLGLSTLACGTKWWIAILDLPVLRMIRWKLHVAFTGYKGAGPLPYLGSPASLPVWVDTHAAHQRMSVCVPELSTIYWEGTGIEAAVRRLDLDFAQELVA
jgi:hypothetical protein